MGGEKLRTRFSGEILGTLNARLVEDLKNNDGQGQPSKLNRAAIFQLSGLLFRAGPLN